MTCAALQADAAQQTEANVAVEIAFRAQEAHANPFLDVTLDVLFTDPAGTQKTVPAFWAGGDQWKVRYASPTVGIHCYRTQCNATDDAGLHGVEGQIEIKPYTGGNPLLKHGFLRVAEDQRHFEHADGTPFFWLGDTWWKCLCKRMTWEGFQELTADRKAKGFSVVQIVCGPYPDEDAFEEMWENEGGKPYLDREFTRVNPAYFDYADRRFEHLVEEGIAPAIVGAWARRDCDAMEVAGVDGLKLHWRYLIARYGPYPVFWILAGELHDGRMAKGPWGEVFRYVRQIDTYQRPIAIHGGGARPEKREDFLFTYELVGGSHRPDVALDPDTNNVKKVYETEAPTPVIMGEGCYEGHMQNGFRYLQRNMFWKYMLSGAAGHTYGAAGIWHAGVEGDPGCASSCFGGRKVYDWTTWREGMTYAGATQVGLGRRLLEEYPWHRFEPHPEWAEEGSFAAGIPGEVRFIYQPKRNIYNWQGTVVKQVETNVEYSAYYFDPATGRRFDQGKVKVVSCDLGTFERHTQPRLYEDDFDRNAVGFTPKGDAAVWRDYGTATKRENGSLSGGKGLLCIVETVDGKDLMVSCASARSNAEAGLVLRFQDPDNYIVALYSPHFKSIFIHDRRDGDWGAMLGNVSTPDIGSEIQLSAAVMGEYAAFLVSDGKRSWRTPPVKVTNTASGKTGLWLFQIGEQQAFGKFEVSSMAADPAQGTSTGQCLAPDLPSPQDWVLVLEREGR